MPKVEGLTRGMTRARWADLKFVAETIEKHKAGVAKGYLDRELEPWTDSKVRALLNELRDMGFVSMIGERSNAKWHRTDKPWTDRYDGTFVPSTKPKAKKQPKKEPAPSRPKRPVWYSEGVKLDDLAAEALQDGHSALYRALRQAATEAMALGGAK